MWRRRWRSRCRISWTIAHGRICGGWRRGDKASVQIKPAAFNERGFVFVSTNYRYVTQVTIDVITSDVAKAIRWTHEHAREYGGDPNPGSVGGRSRGGS